ncbi:MAG: hypothetical protein SVG88_10555 [Halobacteriales archaeon]|nr:hypothetical protein [Halobacteriales archaeon]
MRGSHAVSDRQFIHQVGAFVIVCTLVLTFSFFGLLALTTGASADIGTRLPFYVFGMAVVFVAGIVGLDQGKYEGREIIVAATGVAIGSFIVFTLGGEGVVLAMRQPGTVFSIQRFLYLLAAGLMATGLGYWVVRNRQAVLSSRRI